MTPSQSSPATPTSSPATAVSDPYPTDLILLRSRPRTVEARQLRADNFDSVVKWIGGFPLGTRAVQWLAPGPGLVLLRATLGDWLVRHADGLIERVDDNLVFAKFERICPVVAE